MKIITNNQPRTLLSIDDLTEIEKAEFEWMDDDAAADDAEFFRYKGHVYTLQDFTRVRDKEGPLASWQGHQGESYFSGILIRRHYYDSVVVGAYYS